MGAIAKSALHGDLVNIGECIGEAFAFTPQLQFAYARRIDQPTSVGERQHAAGRGRVAPGTVEFTDGGILAGTASSGVLGAILVLYVFGVGKAAVMPFHRWLPAAMVAPTPVSALLHAVAVVKAGVFTVLTGGDCGPRVTLPH